MTALLPAMAGANMLYGLGMLESGITISYAQLLLDNEAASFVRRCLKGVPVVESTEAVELIKKIGPRGNFLSQKHTRTNMREHLYPQFADRKTRDSWVREGSLDVNSKAEVKAREIMKTHRAAPLSAETLAAMDELIKRADKCLAE